MTGTPRVSVVLPTRNRLGTLPRAIDSVFRQDVADLELIVVDDGSTDGTAAWLDKQACARLRFVRHENGRGAAAARNTGVRAARAELVAFQDSDDEWLPGRLQRQLALLDKGGAEVGWVGGAQILEGPQGRILVCAGAEPELLLLECFATPVWLVRRNFLERAGLFDEAMPVFEDADLVFRLARVCRLAAVAEPVVIRHVSADSLYGTLPQRKRGLAALLGRHRETWLRDPQRYARWCVALARLHGIDGEVEGARRWLREARAFGWRRRDLLLLGATFLGRATLQYVAGSRFAPALAPPPEHRTWL